MKNHSNKIVCAALFVALGFTAVGDTIYDSFSSYNGNSFQLSNGQEIGNQIAVSPGLWTLTNFSIEYHTINTILAANVGIQVRFYTNNGTPVNGFATPGDLFYDSGWFYNAALGGMPGIVGTNNGFNVVTYNTSDFGVSLVLPGTFTFTIAFTNLDLSNQIDLPLANNQSPISVGDYWINNGGAWSLMTNSGSAANFVVDFAGTPEPSVFGLGAIGCALLFGAKKLRRKR